MTEKRQNERMTELKKRAEALLKSSPVDLPDNMSPSQIRDLVHELHTHQIELEMQNDELRSAQVELEESRRQYTDLYDFAPVGYLTISDKGIILRANLTAGKILGIERRSLVNQRLSSFILPEDQDDYYHCRQALIQSTEEQACDRRMKKQDGSVFYAQLKSIVIPEVDGNTGQYRTTVTDITKRKEVEQAVINGKREWQETFDAITDVITIQDDKFRIIRANKAAHDLFQVEMGELNGRYCYEVFQRLSSPCPGCLDLHELKEKNDFREQFSHKVSGRTFLVTASLIIDRHGQLEKIVHVGRDITEQKKIEKELSMVKKMEATVTLAGGIAHNFNNILTVVTGNQELVLDTMSLPRKERGYIEASYRAARRAVKLSRMMLQFVGQESTRKQIIQVTKLINDMVDILRPEIKANIELHHHNNVECFINSDYAMIQQVITNLVINAAEAIGDDEGQITIKHGQKYFSQEELRQPFEKEQITAGVYVFIEVRDSGAGMDSEVMYRAFDPFFTRKFTGRGLGLATVLGIVRAHSGTVSLTSEPGKGTTVTVFLPAEVPPELIQQGALQTDSATDILTGTVLIVDDEPMLLELQKALFEQLGLASLHACDGVEALDIYEKNRKIVDIVVLDISMPRLDGIGVLKKIRETSKVPVIIVTGYPIDKVLGDINRFENVSIMKKPYRLNEMRSKLQEMI